MLRKNRQGGATLVVGLIMLLVLTLLVVASIRSSNSNLRIAGNMQVQEEGIVVAQQTIEQLLSTNFTASPAASSVTVSINNATYTASTATPLCRASTPLRNENLDATNAADATCIGSGSTTTTGIYTISGASEVTAAPGPSWCSSQHWEIRARVMGGGSDLTLNQGVFLRVPAGTPCT